MAKSLEEWGIVVVLFCYALLVLSITAVIFAAAWYIAGGFR